MFAVGLALVVMGSDTFVDAAVRIAKRFRISEMLIGATLVSIGTTLPELMVSATAAFQGHVDMAAGNAIGSVICNTALIAGLTQAVRPSKIDPEGFRKSYSQFFLAMLAFCLFAYTGRGLSAIAGTVLLVVLVFHLADSWKQAKDDRGVERPQTVESPLWYDLFCMVVTAGALFLGARLLVENGSLIARAIGIPEHAISISMIALGTSLPELLTALAALRKRHSALSLGNIIGANILNLLLVSGVSSVIEPIPMTACMLQIDMPIMIFVSLLLALPGMIRGKLYRWQGGALLATYAGYMAYLYLAR